MKTSVEKLQIAQKYAIANRPKIEGFPFLAECLRKAGVERNEWFLPASESIYFMKSGTVINQGSPLVGGMVEVPVFDREAFLAALCTDQSGQGTFPEFLMAAWNAGVVRYEVNFLMRTIVYYGARGECYEESYPGVEVGTIEGL